MLTKKQIIAKIRKKPAVIDAHCHVGIDPATYLIGAFPYCMSVEDQVLRMRMFKIDFAAVFPLVYTEYFSLGAFRKGKFRRDPNSTSPFPYKHENSMLMRELYEAFPQYAGTLLPFAFFDPGRRQKEQAAFINELAGNYPVFGIKTASSYLQSLVRDLLKKGTPLLDVAADHNMALMLHSAVRPGDPWADVFDILKVARERPDVRVCIAHTCRFDRRALEMASELENCFVDFSAFNIHCQLARTNNPSIAPKKHRFPADYRDHAGAMQKIAEAYPDTMLWATDTPGHYFMARFIDDKGEEVWMNLYCNPETETAEFRKMPASIRRRISYTNTLRYLFGE